MKHTYCYLLLTILFFCQPIIAKCDHIVINGIHMRVVSREPLRNHPRISELALLLKGYATDCTEDNCMFEAEWKIMNRRLMLTQISNCACNQKKQTADLQHLYIGKLENGMIPADWYTGQIWVSTEQPTAWLCMVCPIYARETCVTVVKGIVTGIKEVVYPRVPSPFKKRTRDSLNLMVYKKLDWNKLKNLPDSNGQVPVFTQFTPDSTGKPGNFTISKYENGKDIDPTWSAEIKKAISTYKWPVYFSHGKFYPFTWSVSLKLNKEQQRNLKRSNR